MSIESGDPSIKLFGRTIPVSSYGENGKVIHFLRYNYLCACSLFILVQQKRNRGEFGFVLKYGKVGFIFSSV